jgi:hypothetical protein
MTVLMTSAGALVAAGALALGGLFGAGSAGPAGAYEPRLGLIIDAPAARHGRDLLDPRLRAVAADVRVPRSAQEARIDARYLAAAGDDILVAVGPRAAEAAADTGLPVRRAADAAEAAALLRR